MLLRDMLARCSENFPNKLAYQCGFKSRTWREMDQRSDRLALALQGLGVRQGDTVSILGKESLEVYEHFFACMKIGAVRVGVNWRYASPQMLHVLRDSATTVLLVQAEFVGAVRSSLGDDSGIKLIGYGADHGLPLDYEALIAAASGASRPAMPMIDPEDHLLISYTSGTTGRAKGALLSHRAVSNAVWQALAGYGFRHDDVWYVPAQSCWVAVTANLWALGNGMTSVIVDGVFEVVQYLREVERLRVTVGLLVPTMIFRAIEEYKAKRYDFSSLRLLVYGASPASPKLIRDAFETFGCDLMQAYGMTESTDGIVSFLQPSDHRYALEHEPELLKSAGRAGVMFELSIRDKDGAPLPPGTMGEIWVKGDTLMTGYQNLPDETRDALRDGWLCTNDLGRMDERGYLYVMDRKKFLIISGAVNVFPATVEAVLMEHPAVEEIAVVGAPHPEWGEAVVGVVKLKDGVERLEAAALIAFCKMHLSGPETPKHFLIVAELAKTASGKLEKTTIKQWVLDNRHLLPWETEA